MAVLDRPVVLPKMMFLACWDMIDLGPLPTAMGGNLHHWMTGQARRDLERGALDSLTNVGMARNGRVNPLWRATLATLAKAEREWYAFSVFASGRDCSTLVASKDGDCVRVVIDDAVIVIESLPDKWHATALLDALPDIAGAAVRPLAVPKAFYDDPDAGRASVLDEPPDTRDLDALRVVMTRPRHATHQLYTAKHDNDGRLSSTPITALDLADQGGRVLTYVTGDDQIVMTPGGPREVIVALNDTHNALSDC
ncbi:ESX secretion-associated protein EspG [Amycolatopsis sp. cmx-8-4]|uniref:ESX secretion-associated protein EspG n=1 Tax=Amycolatopsis sp. cmx-8-4 TaxID=2790947 RepID=UPI0039796067